MAVLMSAALFEKRQRVLVVRRRRAPFAGQYVLPMAAVQAFEAAEEAMRRHAAEQFGMTLEGETESFAETVYLEEAEDRYVANIFRTPLPEGPLRFNASGDYDDARWCAASDLVGLPMPPDLRLPLEKLLDDPDALHELDWDAMGRELNAQALPLAERGASAVEAAAPDNRAAWDAIAKPYQEERYGDRHAGRLMWTWGVFEDELHLLDDVRNKRVLVLGCGGGQDVVALGHMGAMAVGIDTSIRQLDYARKYLSRHPANNASFAEADMADLGRFDDASFDAAVAVHSLCFVGDAAAACTEASRVLKTGGTFIISVSHPFGHTRAAQPPYGVAVPYWRSYIDREWRFEDGTIATIREFKRTLQQWFDLLGTAGFAVERVIEPRVDVSPDNEWRLDAYLATYEPYTLILKARKR